MSYYNPALGSFKGCLLINKAN